MTDAITIVVPWTPDTRCRPNAKCSERTKIRYRKQGAKAAGYPLKTWEGVPEGVYGPTLFEGPVWLDIEIRWEKGRQFWDDDAVVTAMKYVRDALETYQIVRNDRDVRIGGITQVRAEQQPETVLRIRRVVEGNA